MAGLDFTLLLNSALKFLTLCWLIAVSTPQIATTKMAVLLISLFAGAGAKVFFGPAPELGM
jgi:hypothetical protein